MFLFLLFVIVIVGAILMGMRHGSATMNEMLEDVATAMVWIQNNPQHLTVKMKRRPRKRHDNEQEQEQQMNEKETTTATTTTTTTRPLFLLGGYSSGGHVAATLLQRPEIWQRHGLPRPEECLDGALFLSGVMATTSVRNTNNDEDENDNNHDDLTGANHSRIGIGLTNLVKYMAFGGGGGDNNDSESSPLPCPLHNVSNAPRIPHLLIGCAQELPFGLPWLDIFFQSRDYAHQLQQHRQIPARYMELPSGSSLLNVNNHWTILASSDLKRALVQGLSWLTEQQEDNMTRTSKNDNKHDIRKKKNMAQPLDDEKNTSQPPDAILDDSSFSEE
jgi:hypothetical protein